MCAIPRSKAALRLNKFISETGICSRRQADKWIAEGRVTCNGLPAALGTQVGAADQVRIDGEPIGGKQRPIYIALNKPVGITSTCESQIDGNIVDLVGHKERIFPIGRLDKDSEGLILLTNDGDVVNEILRSENDHQKEYIVDVNRPITDLSLAIMRGGVRIMGVTTKPCEVTRIDSSRFRMILTQGLNRQIRRMCSALGYRVERLQRVRIVNVELGSLGVGEWRNLTPTEIADLLPAKNQSARRSAATTPSDHRRPTVARQSGSEALPASHRKKSGRRPPQ